MDLPSRLPFAPLERRFARYSASTGMGLVELLGGSHTAERRAYFRARSKGYVTPASADHLCGLLGLHPGEVYGEAWLGKASCAACSDTGEVACAACGGASCDDCRHGFAACQDCSA